jgi:hypothetical protein
MNYNGYDQHCEFVIEHSFLPYLTFVIINHSIIYAWAHENCVNEIDINDIEYNEDGESK